jgi:hypothetical protein
VLIPGLAATGLSLPLPSAVERIAAALVPWAEAATLSDQPLAVGAAGSIVLTSTERRSGGEAAPSETTSARPQGKPQKRPKPSGARGTARNPPANSSFRAAPKAAGPSTPADRKTVPEQSAVEPDPTVPILASAEPTRSPTADPRPETGTLPKPPTGGLPLPAPGPLPQQDPGIVPTPNTDPPPVPAQPEPVQQPLAETVSTVVETTQTVLEDTTQVATEVLEPVTAIVSSPVEALLGLLRGLLPGRGGK